MGKVMNTYFVSIEYQTPCGGCGIKNFNVEADDEELALEECKRKVLYVKGRTIDGGSAILLKQK